MRFNAVDRMLPARDAFSSLRGGAASSRVAALQTMTASMLGGAEVSLEARVSEAVPIEGAEALSVAPITDAKPAEFWAKPGIETLTAQLGDGSRRALGALDAVGELDRAPTVSQRLAPLRAVYRECEEHETDAESLKLLLEASLTGPTVLERVASAQMLDSLSHGEHPTAVQVLERGVASRSEEIRSIAEISSLGAGGASGDAPRRAAQARAGGATGRPVSTDLSFVLHGTWARLSPNPWYAPGSDLHVHIRSQVSQNLYQGTDYPRWSGGYDAGLRTLAAHELLDWVKARTGGTRVDTIYAHSHGGNVVLEAMTLGLEARMLVLLHVPPRPRSDAEWATIRSHTERTMVYRVTLDRVVMADMIRVGAFGGAMSQRFDRSKLPHVDSEPHPFNGPWFDHGHYTKLDTWTTVGVANDISYYLGEPPMRLTP